MGTVENLSPAEKRAYDLITSRDGLFQSELWKALDATSRQGSRLATSLEEKGFIEREPATNSGQRTYLLTPTNKEPPPATETASERTERAPTTKNAEDPDARQARGLSLIHERGGIYQSELWKELDVSSRTGSQLARTLAENGSIRREKATYNGQRTFLLTPSNGQTPAPTQTASEHMGSTSEDETEHAPTARDERALALIYDRGGIYQSVFWKELDVSSRTGSRIATSLEERGLIRREEVTYNGQRTYLLLPAKKELDFSLLMAGNMISPLIGATEDVDPLDSTAFNQWLLQLADEKR